MSQAGMKLRIETLRKEMERRKGRVCSSKGMDEGDYELLFDFFYSTLVDILGSDIHLAYRWWGRQRGKNESVFASYGYIMAEPIDPFIETLEKQLKSDSELYSHLFRPIYTDRSVFNLFITDVMTTSQINVYEKYGPFAKSLDHMLDDCGLGHMRRLARRRTIDFSS